jgi:hypothetical protein
MDSITETETKLDKRRKAAHPERITVGHVVFERNDVRAAHLGVSERTLNRDDRDGAPYRLFGNVKYRPVEQHNAFILTGIRQDKPTAPRKRRRKTT